MIISQRLYNHVIKDGIVIGSKFTFLERYSEEWGDFFVVRVTNEIYNQYKDNTEKIPLELCEYCYVK